MISEVIFTFLVCGGYQHYKVWLDYRGWLVHFLAEQYSASFTNMSATN